MRNPLPEVVENSRVTDGRYGSERSFGPNGVFMISYQNKELLNIMASNGGGWDHVSVSLRSARRCPTWDEMCFVKELFFADDEWVVQFHPAHGENINNHPHCLHLWRPQNAEMPTPPRIFVGIPS